MIPGWAIESGGDREWPLGKLFALGCRLDGAKPAIADRKMAYTFAALENLANGYAARLAKDYGIRPQDRVMVVCRKTCRVPALAVGLWKLGAVYMPVDAELPAARLAGIVASAQPKLVVTLDMADATAVADCLAMAGMPDIAVNLDAVGPDAVDDPVAPYRHRPGDIAYVIHTSGSTGAPKGVQITAASLRDYFHAHNRMLRFAAQSRVISFTPFHFDVSIEDTLLPLSLGAFVYQYNGPAIGEMMRRTLARERITHLIAVSTVLTVISDRPDCITPAAFPDLEMVMTGAEVCAPSVVNLWASRLPRARVYNVYGPTEVTIVCMGYHVDRPQDGRMQPYPIGLPLDGVTAILLDADGCEIAAVDEIGELCLGGSQVMAGYLGSADAAGSRIFERDGMRFYRSGDRCRRDGAGFYHFVGRVDAEVKLNGRRINLAEIEAECLAVPAVARAAVGLIDMPGGRSVIGAVLVADDRTVVDDVRARLLAQLPAYMLPALWGLGSQVRLGRSGKTDNSLLLALLAKQAALDRSDTVIDIA